MPSLWEPAKENRHIENRFIIIIIHLKNNWYPWMHINFKGEKKMKTKTFYKLFYENQIRSVS